MTHIRFVRRPPRLRRALVALLITGLIGAALLVSPESADAAHAQTAAAATSVSNATPAPGYTFVRGLLTPTGQGAYFLFVDSSRHRLYGIDEGTASLFVSDTRTNATIAQIAIANLVSFAVDTKTNTIYASSETDSGGGILTVISGTTFAVTARVPLELWGTRVLIDSGADLVYVLHQLSFGNGTIITVSGSTHRVLASIVTDVGLASAVVNPANHALYLAITGEFQQSHIEEVLPTTGRVIRTYLFRSQIAEMLLDPVDDSLFFTADDGYVTKLDLGTGAILNKQASGGNGFLALDPARNTLYVGAQSGDYPAISGGEIFVLNAATGDTVTEVDTGPYPDVIALDTSTHKLFVSGVTAMGVLTSPASGVPLPTTASPAPSAALTNATGTLGYVDVTGWAVLSGRPAAQPMIRVQIDGVTAGTVASNLTDPTSLATQPGAGNDHGYSIGYFTSTGAHTVCLTALGIGISPRTLSLGCRRVVVVSPPSPVFGAISSVQGFNRTITVSGWAAKEDNTEAPVSLFLQFRGHTYPLSTGVRDSDGNGEGAGPDQGFWDAFASPTGWQSLCILAKPTSGPLEQFGCSEVYVSAAPAFARGKVKSPIAPPLRTFQQGK